MAKAAKATQALSLDDMLKESREKRKAEVLAQEIFGKRSRTPATAGKTRPGATLASRVGVTKRNTSLTRTNSAPALARNARAPQQQFSRPQPREDNFRARQPYAQQPQSDLVSDIKSNGFVGYDVAATNGSAEAGVSIRGAAAGPHVVVAQNFAPGTTAADIESVMLDVGGQMTDCRLVRIEPTVIAEMTFVDRAGAETVINTFNNKKADGRTLHVFWKTSASDEVVMEAELPVEPVEDTMEVDGNALSREAEDRLREERRGGNDRGPREPFPSAPRGDRGYDGDYYRGPRRADPPFQDNRYGFGRGDRYNYAPRGRYRDSGRMYSDSMRRGGNGGGGGSGSGQSWRP